MGIEHLLGALGFGAVVGALARKEHLRGPAIGFSAEEWQRDYQDFRRRVENQGSPTRSPRTYEPRVPQTAESTIPDDKLDDLRDNLCDMAKEYENASESRKKALKKAFDQELSKLDPFTRGLVKDYLKRVCGTPQSPLVFPGVMPPPLPPRPVRTGVRFIETQSGPVRGIDTGTPTGPPPTPTGTGGSGSSYSGETIRITPRPPRPPVPTPTPEPSATPTSGPASYYRSTQTWQNPYLRNRLLSLALGPGAMGRTSMGMEGALWTGSILSLSGAQGRLPAGGDRKRFR